VHTLPRCCQLHSKLLYIWTAIHDNVRYYTSAMSVSYVGTSTISHSLVRFYFWYTQLALNPINTLHIFAFHYPCRQLTLIPHSNLRFIHRQYFRSSNNWRVTPVSTFSILALYLFVLRYPPRQLILFLRSNPSFIHHQYYTSSNNRCANACEYVSYYCSVLFIVIYPLLLTLPVCQSLPCYLTTFILYRLRASKVSRLLNSSCSPFRNCNESNVWFPCACIHS